MAIQRNAATIEGLIAQTEAGLEGVRTLGADLNIQEMEAILLDGLNAARQAQENLANAKADLSAKRVEYRLAFDAQRKFVLSAMTFFKLTFGAQWNGKWEVLQLPVGSLRVPVNKPDLLALAECIQRYLAAHPEMELASNGITAVNATAVTTAAKAARAAVNAAKATVRLWVEARLAAIKLLGLNLTLLRSHLRRMGPDDYRWYTFGYSRPADPNIPETPGDVRVSVVAPEEIAVKWSPARRADRYKVYIRAQGVDEVPRLAETTTLTEAHIGQPATGTSYEIMVTAVNAAGESLPSAPVKYANAAQDHPAFVLDEVENAAAGNAAMANEGFKGEMNVNGAATDRNSSDGSPGPAGCIPGYSTS